MGWDHKWRKHKFHSHFQKKRLPGNKYSYFQVKTIVIVAQNPKISLDRIRSGFERRFLRLFFPEFFGIFGIGAESFNPEKPILLTYIFIPEFFIGIFFVREDFNQKATSGWGGIISRKYLCNSIPKNLKLFRKHKLIKLRFHI